MMNNFTLRSVMAMSFLMLLSTLGFAQTARLQGRVVDSEGVGVAGATVYLLGQQTSTSTGTDIVVDDNTLDMTLTSSMSSLDEVVVIGYGTQRKGDLTGSVTTVSSKDFQKGLITSPEQLIAGKAAGVQITTSGGQPGGGATI